MEEPKTIFTYFKAREIADKLNKDTEDNWNYKVIAIPNMKAFIEIWEDQYLIGVF